MSIQNLEAYHAFKRGVEDAHTETTYQPSGGLVERALYLAGYNHGRGDYLFKHMTSNEQSVVVKFRDGGVA